MRRIARQTKYRVLADRVEDFYLVAVGFVVSKVIQIINTVGRVEHRMLCQTVRSGRDTTSGSVAQGNNRIIGFEFLNVSGEGVLEIVTSPQA